MLTIRELEERDIEALTLLEKEAFGKNAWSEKDFKESLTLDYAYYIVAEEDGEIAGECGYRNMCGDADIMNVCVRPDKLRRGIAEKLLKKLMEYGEGHGVNAFTLEVRKGNRAAIELYEKLGFETEGIRPGFYEDPDDDAVIMWKR